MQKNRLKEPILFLQRGKVCMLFQLQILLKKVTKLHARGSHFAPLYCVNIARA